MVNYSSFINQDEVKQLIDLIQKLDDSSFEFMELEKDNVKIVIGKGETRSVNTTQHSSFHQEQSLTPASKKENETGSIESTQVKPPEPSIEKKDTNIKNEQPADGTITITAITPGRFYARPEPGAEPYAQVGDKVKSDTTVGLLEVMKMYTAVLAGIEGIITEVCVEDAEIVEYGQPLFRVKPAAQSEDTTR